MEPERLHDFHDRTHPVNEDITFQRKVWRFERGGWYVLLVIILLTLAGLFSKGPLSSRELESENGTLRVKYELFNRNGDEDSVVIHAYGKPDSTIVLEIGGELFEGNSIQTLQPQPLRTTTSGRDLRFTLQTDSEGEATLYMTLQSDGAGLYRGYLKLLPNQSVDFSRFIYP